VPKIVTNNTINYFFKSQSAVSECCLIKLLPCILFDFFIFKHWKWSAQGASTVPIVSAHFRSVWLMLVLSLGSVVTAAYRLLLRHVGR